MQWIRTQAHKLHWRLELLAQPERCLGRQPCFADATRFPLRRAMLDAARSLSLAERLRLVAPGGGRERDRMLWRRLRQRGPDGQEYFVVDGRRIYFRPDHPVADEARLLEGTQLILREAFDRPVEFFDPPVEIAPGDVVLDLGGNIGTSAMLFAPLVGEHGRVYSFEPVFHGVLARNVAENGLANVHVVAAGVSDRPGEAEFAVTDIGIDSRMARTPGGGRQLRVALTTVDDFVARERLERVDFMKLDIEGAEELALRGAERTLRELAPKLSVASYHTDPEGDAQHPKLVRLLRQFGYTVREAGQRHIYAWREAQGRLAVLLAGLGVELEGLQLLAHCL